MAFVSSNKFYSKKYFIGLAFPEIVSTFVCKTTLLKGCITIKKYKHVFQQ